MRCISRSDAQVWRVRARGRRPLDLALRLYTGGDEQASALDDEIDWLRALAEQGLHVPRPVPAVDGRWRVSMGPSGAHAIVLHWLPGRMRWASLRPLHLRRVGVFIAQLHQSAWQRQRRGLITSLRRAYGPDLPALAAGSARLRAWGTPACQWAVQRAATALHAELAAWPRDDGHWGWIHGDLHPWNLLFDGGRAGAIDFSDAGWAPLAQDLAAVLQFLRQPIAGPVDHRAHLPALEGSLFEGYASVRPLPPGLQRQAGLLHGLRVLNTLQWMLDAWSGPDERPWGPAFLAGLPAALKPLRAG